MLKKICGLTMVELLISMALVSMIMLGFYSFDSFSRYHVINTDRRAKVQNDLSYAIEYMSKNVQQSIGDFNNPPIKSYPAPSNQTGFQVRRDLRNPQIPSDLGNCTWVEFSLSGSSNITSGSETLTSRISGAFANTTMPANPTAGFYVRITDPGPDQGMAVDVGLNGLYNTSAASSVDNPKASIKTRLISPSSSAN